MTAQALGLALAVVWLVESDGDYHPADGDGGKAVGPLQIWMCVVEDVNQRYGTEYTSADRRDLSRSVEIFCRYQMMYPSTSLEGRCRLWNGGPSRRGTDGYWAKCKRALERIEKWSTNIP